MRCGKIYMDFDSMKKAFNLPDDALLKYINANNETNEIEITFIVIVISMMRLQPE